MSGNESDRNQAPVLLAGATGQLGRAIATALTAAGAELVITDRPGAPLDELAEHLRTAHRNVRAIAADLTDPVAVRELVAGVGRLGLRGCVNASGWEGPIGPAEELDLEATLRLFEIDVFAMMRLTREVLPALRSTRGSLVNLASGAGLRGSALMSAYSAAKHAVVGFTRSVAIEMAPFRVAVNAVCPGVVASPMMDRITEEIGEKLGHPVDFARRLPSARMADADEIADVVTYLALDAPAYLTGACVPVAGAALA